MEKIMIEKIDVEKLIEKVKEKSVHYVRSDNIIVYKPMLFIENIMKSFCEEINKVIDEINKKY